MRLAEFNKFNNTGAGMLDFIYHRTLKLSEFSLTPILDYFTPTF